MFVENYFLFSNFFLNSLLDFMFRDQTCAIQYCIMYLVVGARHSTSRSCPSPKSKIHDTHLLVIDRFFFYFVKLRFDGKKDLTKESDGRTDKGRGDLMPPPKKTSIQRAPQPTSNSRTLFTSAHKSARKSFIMVFIVSVDANFASLFCRLCLWKCAKISINRKCTKGKRGGSCIEILFQTELKT